MYVEVINCLKTLINHCFQGLKKARAHGLGVHKQEEIVELGTADLRVLSDLLADKPFFFGNEPTLVCSQTFRHISRYITK